MAKITGKEGLRFEGRANVFDAEEGHAARPGGGKDSPRATVIVIRYERTEGRPRDAGDADSDPPAVMGAGLGSDVALITDGRFSGGSHGFIIGHVGSRRRREGGPIGLLETGDHIVIDAEENSISVDVSDEGDGSAPGGMDDARVQGDPRHPVQVHQERCPTPPTGA